MIIRELRVTPIAFADSPLLNVDGVHEPHVLQAVIELVVDEDRGGEVTGLGECTRHSWQGSGFRAGDATGTHQAAMITRPQVSLSGPIRIHP